MHLGQSSKADIYCTAPVSTLAKAATIASDAIFIGLTWVKTFGINKQSSKSGMSAPFTTLVLRDGTAYFLYVYRIADHSHKDRESLTVILASCCSSRSSPSSLAKSALCVLVDVLVLASHANQFISSSNSWFGWSGPTSTKCELVVFSLHSCPLIGVCMHPRLTVIFLSRFMLDLRDVHFVDHHPGAESTFSESGKVSDIRFDTSRIIGNLGATLSYSSTSISSRAPRGREHGAEIEEVERDEHGGEWSWYRDGDEKPVYADDPFKTGLLLQPPVVVDVIEVEEPLSPLSPVSGDDIFYMPDLTDI